VAALDLARLRDAEAVAFALWLPELMQAQD